MCPDMALADHFQEERDRIYETLVEIIGGPFVPDRGEVHTCLIIQVVFL